jgi:hypothetical protein
MPRLFVFQFTTTSDIPHFSIGKSRRARRRLPEATVVGGVMGHKAKGAVGHSAAVGGGGGIVVRRRDVNNLLQNENN